MKPCTRNASTLAALLLLPLLQALCPRLAPDVISGKVIPCRYLCIKINFFELPSIVLGTEKDGVLCSTLLLRRRGVCKNGGCIPFGTEEEIKPKGTFGKVILAIDKFASGSFSKKAPEPGTPFGPIVTTATSIAGGGSGSTAEGTPETSSNPIASAAMGALAGKMGSTLKKLFSGKRAGDRKSESPGPISSVNTPQQQPNEYAATSSDRAVVLDSPPIAPPSTNGNEMAQANGETGRSSTVGLPSNVQGSESSSSIVSTPVPSSSPVPKKETPSESPLTSPPVGAESSQGNPDATYSETAPQGTGISEGAESSKAQRGLETRESHAGHQRRPSFLSSFASSARTGARRATSILSRFRRSYTV